MTARAMVLAAVSLLLGACAGPRTMLEHGGPEYVEDGCKVQILAGDASPLASTKTWRSAVSWLAVKGDAQPEARPKSQEAARARLCGQDRCDGPGPWVVELRDPVFPEHEVLAVAMPRPDGKLELLADSWHADPDDQLVVTRIDDGPWLHLRIEWQTGLDLPSCATIGGGDGPCRLPIVSKYDWLLDTNALTTLGVIVRGPTRSVQL